MIYEKGEDRGSNTRVTTCQLRYLGLKLPQCPNARRNVTREVITRRSCGTAEGRKSESWSLSLVKNPSPAPPGCGLALLEVSHCRCGRSRLICPGGLLPRYYSVEWVVRGGCLVRDSRGSKSQIYTLHQRDTTGVPPVGPRWSRAWAVERPGGGFQKGATPEPCES